MAQNKTRAVSKKTTKKEEIASGEELLADTKKALQQARKVLQLELTKVDEYIDALNWHTRFHW